jgi:nitric oxide reductase NorQ protein
VIVAIHSLTDHRRKLYLDKLAEEVSAHKDFMLVASFNPGYQKGFKELKPSTRQRFVSLSFDYPDEVLETEIIVNETSLNEKDAKRLVKIANKIRNLKELGLVETVSTRLVVDSAKLIKSGLSKRLSVEVGMLQPLSDEAEIMESMKDLADLMI